MKAIVQFTLIVALAMCIQAIPEDAKNEEWANYKAKFGKQYIDPETDQQHKEIYFQHKEEIEAHNRNFDLGKTTYQQGINHLTDLTPEEHQQHLGFKPIRESNY